MKEEISELKNESSKTKTCFLNKQKISIKIKVVLFFFLIE